MTTRLRDNPRATQWLAEIVTTEVLDLLVPAEGIEPPTFGLQNRCSTAELSRHFYVISTGYDPWRYSRFERPCTLTNCPASRPAH